MALPVNRLIRVTVNLSPVAAAVRSFGVLMVAGDSNVIDGIERFRTYDGISAIADEFGTSAPEYFAGVAYFGQTPKPKTMMIGRWFRTASAGFNRGAILTSGQQAMSNFTVITSGTLQITIDGVVKNLASLDFSAQTNLNGVASVINLALTGGVVSWTGSRFLVTSSTTGIASIVGFATVGALATAMHITSAGGAALVSGYAAETPVECAAALANISNAWYGLQFAAATQPTDDQSMDVSAFIEALTVKRIYGVTIVTSTVLDSGVTNDLASRQKDAGYLRSFCQYSSTSAYAIASFFGRAFSVNFNGNKTTITLMYKQEPGITAETLTTTQANTLQSKRCNVLVNYDNDTKIIQYGVMSGPAWFDEIHGLDWLENAIQTAVYNALYTSTTKVPQTDSGSNVLVTAVNGVNDQAVRNGLLAPGVWTGDPFGQLKTGDYLNLGYYTFCEAMADQADADRQARIAPPITTAVKLAGAIQEADVIIQVNR